ncbi:hypothetical protein TIFTF001_037723 [Ficus carica]|uniref:Uncharacterized protein n=2 Tax=Ficus carica TaxID=3494 RepID=A0AA88EHF4_FICCA|nr:hypothetical protein TIFTF001_037723 [Ficus carica]
MGGKERNSKGSQKNSKSLQTNNAGSGDAAGLRNSGQLRPGFLKMQHQRLKQQAMMQHSLYHHPAVLAAPQKRAFRTLHVRVRERRKER